MSKNLKTIANLIVENLTFRYLNCPLVRGLDSGLVPAIKLSPKGFKPKKPGFAPFWGNKSACILGNYCASSYEICSVYFAYKVYA